MSIFGYGGNYPDGCDFRGTPYDDAYVGPLTYECDEWGLGPDTLLSDIRLECEIDESGHLSLESVCVAGTYGAPPVYVQDFIAAWFADARNQQLVIDRAEEVRP